MFNSRSRVLLSASIQRSIVDGNMCRAMIAFLVVLVAVPVWAQDHAPRFVAAWGKQATPDGRLDPLAIAANAQGDVFVIHRYQVKKDE